MHFKFGMLKNKIACINNWLDKNGYIKFLIIFIYVVFVMFLFYYRQVFFGITLFIIISFYGVFMNIIHKYNRLKGVNFFNFDHSLYNIPEIGETIVITKFLNYDINKADNFKNYLNTPFIIEIIKGAKFEVVDVKEIKCNFIISLKLLSYEDIVVRNPNNNPIKILYFDTNKNWKTISDLRDDKLNKILNNK